jgi:hypothetical protein
MNSIANREHTLANFMRANSARGITFIQARRKNISADRLGKEQQEGSGKDCKGSKFECNFLADGCENSFHKVKVFLRVRVRALKILEGYIERVYAPRGS